MQEGHNAQYYAEKQKHSTVASKKVFDAMVAKDWNKVKELIVATSWTPQALEEKHGVRTELVAPLEADPSADQFAMEYIILLYLKVSVFAILLFIFILRTAIAFFCLDAHIGIVLTF